MNLKLFWLITAFLLIVNYRAEAQQSRTVAKIGYLSAGSTGSMRTIFREALRELGYFEGKNIVIEYRAAEGNYERLHDLATELVRLQMDVIFANSTLAARAAKQATRAIPIVIFSGDPVGAKLVASLARPDGNITGVTNLSPDLSTKRLELIKETLPRAALIAVIWDSGGPVPIRAFKDTELAAQTLGIKTLSLPVSSSVPDLKGAFQTASKMSAAGLIVISNPLTVSFRKQII
jgi:putative ABC transport system substrate-binding protein